MIELDLVYFRTFGGNQSHHDGAILKGIGLWKQR